MKIRVTIIEKTAWEKVLGWESGYCMLRISELQNAGNNK